MSAAERGESKPGSRTKRSCEVRKSTPLSMPTIVAKLKPSGGAAIGAEGVYVGAASASSPLAKHAWIGRMICSTLPRQIGHCLHTPGRACEHSQHSATCPHGTRTAEAGASQQMMQKDMARTHE